jgi:hypothetical protein
MSMKGGGAKRDNAATAEAKRTGRFRCKNSFIATDGREFLSRGDWERRVAELFQRSPFCECVSLPTDPGGAMKVCGAPGAHPHHKLRRQKGGDDSLSNLISICFEHHKEAHPEKQTRWTSREAVRLQDRE